MKAVLPAVAVLGHPSTREAIILQGLDGLVLTTGSLKSGSLGDLLAARSVMLAVIDEGTALAGLVRGLGPGFTQGEWRPLVERLHEATNQSHDDLVGFLRDARLITRRPRLLNGIGRACDAVMRLGDEATLLAGRAAWAE
jgi:hypothetical protein